MVETGYLYSLWVLEPTVWKSVQIPGTISKKLIYMVMEAGDMDLAHTLEEKKTKEKFSLDEDFLRVAWRQVCF